MYVRLPLQAGDLASIFSNYFMKAFVRSYLAAIHALKDLLLVHGFLIALVFPVPQMVNLRRQKPVFATDAQMAQAKDEIGIFMAPPFKGLIKTIDRKKIPTPYAKIATPDAAPLETLFYPE